MLCYYILLDKIKFVIVTVIFKYVPHVPLNATTNFKHHLILLVHLLKNIQQRFECRNIKVDNRMLSSLG